MTTVRGRHDHERWKVTIVESLKPPDHLQGKWSLLICLGLAVFCAPRLVWFMCPGAVLTLPGPADLCRVFGRMSTVECLRDWPCGSHTSPQHLPSGLNDTFRNIETQLNWCCFPLNGYCLRHIWIREIYEEVKIIMKLVRSTIDWKSCYPHAINCCPGKHICT